jgi:hypothetical protein
MINLECVETTGRRLDIVKHIYGRCREEDHGYQIDGEASSCYVYQGSDSGKEGRGANYPKVSIDGQMVRAHRVIFICFEGFLHSKRQVDHRCGIRMCVRFEHLRKATQKQNSLYRDIKNGVERRKRKRKNGRVSKRTTDRRLHVRKDRSAIQT